MLKNKVALVTGASSGIGRAVALMWAREGAKVVVSDVNVQAGEETAALVRAAGGDAIFVAADVGKPADCEALVHRTVAHYGRLDVACNNAGIGGPQAPTADYPLDGWAQVININLSGVFYGMKYQIAAMLQSGGGAIVNNASIVAQIGFPGMASYNASKHAVMGLTQTAALEYFKQGIRVNAVCPGPIETPMSLHGFGSADALHAMMAQTPAGRAGQPDEVVQPVLFLLSQAASYISGQGLTVDGGYTVQ